MNSTQTPFLEMKDVAVRRGTTLALHHVSLTLRLGESVAILGPNGCGKSTLVKTITRECYPFKGQITLFGQPFWDVFELRRKMGIVTPDLERLFQQDISIHDALLSGFFASVGLWKTHKPTAAMRRKALEVIRFLDLESMAKRFLTTLSSGQIQRAMIGRALIHNPQVLVLDEPTNNLDLKAKYEFLEVVRKLIKKGTTVVIVTHHLSDIVPEINRVILLKKNRVVGDGPKHKLLTSSGLGKLFGMKLQVISLRGFYGVSSKA